MTHPAVRARDALRFLAQNFGGEILIVTNQPPVGRGLVTRQQIHALHDWMTEQVEEAGGRIDGLFICPHDPKDGCHCRKPRAGLFQEAEELFNLDLSRSAMVGDTLTDMQGARAAGIRECYRVSTGLPFESPLQDPETYTIVRDLSEAVLAITRKERT
jgi:D-glycero-D-manno-heptose 1,7-bisphosphate phosphatase